MFLEKEQFSRMMSRSKLISYRNGKMLHDSLDFVIILKMQ